MIARRISSKLPVLAYHPPKVFDPDYFNHIHAAGALPVLDTEFFTNTDIIQMIEQLGQADVLFGLRLAADNQALRDYLQRFPIPSEPALEARHRLAELAGKRNDAPLKLRRQNWFFAIIPPGQGGTPISISESMSFTEKASISAISSAERLSA